MSAAIEQRNQDATLWVGNLDDQVDEELLWELMLQAGPVVSLHMPKDKVRILTIKRCFLRTNLGVGMRPVKCFHGGLSTHTNPHTNYHTITNSIKNPRNHIDSDVVSSVL